jgi:serine phosphatase RsbU (regulator of sigma subunit)
MGGAGVSTIEVERQAGVGVVADDSQVSGRRPPLGWALVLPTATVLFGLVIAVALSIASHSVYERDQRHLLRLRVRDAGSLLTTAVPGIQTTLASAAELADATGGNAEKFTRFITPYAGTGAAHEFASVSLWRVSSVRRSPVVLVGEPLKLTDPRVQDVGLFRRAVETGTLGVVGLLGRPDPRIGYAYATPGATGGFVVYAETHLPADKRSPIARSSAFAGLNYALYLGRDREAKNLLLTSAARLPLTGAAASVTIPFGDSALTLVMAARGPLDGSLPRDLPWIILLGGLLMSAAAGLGSMRLTQRRRVAERLAAELERSAIDNRRLYAEQRNIAQTLQHALLPDHLPNVQGVETSARYQAGDGKVDIGGDWYDVIEIDGSRLLLVVGDVSGRGLRAATTMAALRYAIRAYAAQGDPPELFLPKLSRLLSVDRDRQLATVLCVMIDVARRAITVTSAGHLPPLLIGDGATEYVHIEIGLPIGVEPSAGYRSKTVSVPADATLLAFTDGLVEHRGETLDDGLDRLARAARGRRAYSLAELLGELVAGLAVPNQDDIAIVGVRWHNS